MSQQPSKRDRLAKRRDQLSAQIQALDARARTKARKDDTRRKIIIGALLIGKAQKDANLAAAIDSLIAKEASPKDRAFLKGWRECVPEAPVKKPAKPKKANSTAVKSEAEQKPKPQNKLAASRPAFPQTDLERFMRDWKPGGTYDPSDPFDLDLLRRPNGKNGGRK